MRLSQIKPYDTGSSVIQARHYFQTYHPQQGHALLIPLSKVALCALMILWLAASGQQLYQSLVTPPYTPPPVTTNPGSASIERKVVDIASLKSVPLFGEVIVDIPKPVEEAPPEEEEIEETRLNLKLKGLFTSEDENVGSAIIANGSREELYRVGEELEGLTEVSLTAVYSDRIKLSNRGKPEVLYLYPEGERLISSSRQQSAFVEPLDAPPAPNGIPEGLGISPEGFQEFVPPTPSGKKLNDIIRVVRERDQESGNMLGFRVSPGRDRDGFEKSGLRVNDVITSMDGEALTDLQTAMSIYRAKREATEVSLIIIREGSELTLDLDLTQLSI